MTRVPARRLFAEADLAAVSVQALALCGPSLHGGALPPCPGGRLSRL